MRRLLAMAAIVVVAGCTSTSGVQITEDQLAQLKKDKATVQTVTATYGQPQSTYVMADGHRMLTYSFSTVHTDAKAFIPVVGPMMAGSGFAVSTATLTFSPDGVLESYATSANNFQSGATVSAGGGK